MRRPIDPRNNGLKEPQKVITKDDAIFIANLDTNGEVSLQTLINAWNKVVKELESQGFRITKGPHFTSGGYYGRSISLSYTYEWENVHYNEAMACYSAELNEYAEQLRLYNEAEEYRKKHFNEPKDIDGQIVRAERRLANLKAVKAGETIPFPKG